MKLVKEEVWEPTQRGYNLRLQAILALEATGEVTDTPMSVPCDVGNFANMVEHVPTGEKQDRYQADTSPNISVLHERQHIRRCSHQCSTCTKNDCGH